LGCFRQLFGALIRERHYPRRGACHDEWQQRDITAQEPMSTMRHGPTFRDCLRVLAKVQIAYQKNSSFIGSDNGSARLLQHQKAHLNSEKDTETRRILEGQGDHVRPSSAGGIAAFGRNER
jgi:hypothetical protein